MKKYLVTGAAGFIGSAIAKKLLSLGHEVWTIDNLSTGQLDKLPPRIHFIQGDCQNPESIHQLQGTIFNAILHFAGQSSAEISFDDPVYDLRTNTEATLRLIDYAIKHGCQRFIYASTMSVYGSVEDIPISENHKTEPLSFYGVGKLASEHYLRIYMDKGLQPTTLRLFNVYGPHQNMSNLRQGMVSIYLAQMLFQDKVIVKGADDRFRDFIYIDDVVDFTCGIIDDSRTYGGVYNVATGIKTTIKTLISKLQKYSGLTPHIEYTSGTQGDQQGITADCLRAQNYLGFNSKVGLDEGLKKTLHWARELKK